MNIFAKLKSPKTPENINDLADETGVAGDAVFSSFDKEVERSDNIKIKDYRKMRDTDATVESLYNIVTRPILATTFGVKADPDDADEEQAEFIRNCLFKQPYQGGMEIPFSLVLEQMLHAVVDGFEVFERVYRYDERSRKIVLKKLALRDATTITLKTDEHGGYDGLRQQATFGNKTVDVVLPAYKTFLFTYGKADNALYGRSAFKSSYKNWDKKQKIEYLDSMALQNSAVRPKILQRISDAFVNGKKGDDRKKALRVLSQLGLLKSVAAIPNGFEVTELEGGNDEGMHQSIERQNSEMARAFLASFSLLGSQGSSSRGSYSLSADQSDIFMLSLKGIMNLIVDHINQYWIADLIDLNYPAGQRHYPEFYFDDLTDESLDFLKSIFMKLIEKDKISDNVVQGIEEQIKSRFEIKDEEEQDRITPEDESDDEDGSDSSDGDNSDTNTPPTGHQPDNTTSDEDDLSGQNPDKVEYESAILNKTAENLNKEESGSNAGKFRREMTEYEKKVNWSAIQKQGDKIEGDFEKAATPLLEDYIRKVAENPDDEVKLPEEYVNLLSETYRKAYNYGKLSASDEEGEKAPKTKKQEAAHMEKYVGFIVEKQTNDIKSLIAEQKMKTPVEADEATAVHSAIDHMLKGLITGAGLKWVTQAVAGTMDTIFGYGMNAGRSDAYAVFDEKQEAVYMWSALMEHTCAECESLDGSVFSAEEKNTSEYQPGEMHHHCRCQWVRITGDKKPKPTGFPANFAALFHISNTKKADLEAEGIVKDGETKKNAELRAKYSQYDHGDTLQAVEDGIRGENVEYLAAFDKDGKKLCEISDGEEASVELPPELLDYLEKNGVKVVTHNHPGNNSLSFPDIHVATTLELNEMRAASSLYDYSIKPGKDGWVDDFLSMTADEMNKLYNQYTDQAWDELTMKAKHDSTLRNMSDAEMSNWITDRAIQQFAKDYNLIYNKKGVKK